MSLSAFKDQIKESFKRSNKGIIFDPHKNIDRVSTGIFKLDYLLKGGLPKGRITELYSFESAGKSSLAMSTVATVLHKKNTPFCDYKPKNGVLYLDVERTCDPVYNLSTFGVDPDDENLLILQPISGEEVTSILDKFLVSSEKLDLLVIDSIEACRSLTEMRKDLTKDTLKVGSHAVLVQHIVHKCNLIAARTGCAVLLINQLRSKISTGREVDPTGGTGFGMNENSLTTTGGNAPRFYASIRLNIGYGGQLIKEDSANSFTGILEKQKIGFKARIQVTKNKLGKRFIQTECNYLYPENVDAFTPTPEKPLNGGWSDPMDLLEIAKLKGNLQQTNTSTKYVGLKITDWVSKLPRRQAEEAWMSDPKVQEDFKALLAKELSDPNRTEIIAAQVDPKTLSEADLDDSDVATIASREDPTSSLTSEDTDPTEELSL